MKNILNILLRKSINLIGIRKPTPRAWVYILVCLLVGYFFNLFILFFSSWIGISEVYRVVGQTPYTYFSILIVPPIFEELVYRGLFLGVFLKLFGKKPAYATIGLIVSSFVFGYIHPVLPYYKVFGAFLLGSIYLFGWKKNIIASSAAHFGLNLAGVFFTLSI